MSPSEPILHDSRLGPIHVKVNPRARRMTFRVAEGELCASVPSGTSRGAVERAVEGLRPRLERMLRQYAGRHHTLGIGYALQTEGFSLRIVEGGGSVWQLRSRPGEVELMAPRGADTSGVERQTWLHKVLTEALRRQAKALLPPRLEVLARQYGLHYDSVKIHHSKGRWGSCSSRGTINLSLYLLLLPSHLIDYVMLHELAHTVEMNHSPRFWTLLDRLTGQKARSLNEELKRYRTEL